MDRRNLDENALLQACSHMLQYCIVFFGLFPKWLASGDEKIAARNTYPTHTHFFVFYKMESYEALYV